MKITRRSACLLIVGTIAAASLPFSAYAQSGKQIIVATDDIPKQLDPLRSQLFAGYRVMINLYDTLIAVDYKDNGLQIDLRRSNGGPPMMLTAPAQGLQYVGETATATFKGSQLTIVEGDGRTRICEQEGTR